MLNIRWASGAELAAVKQESLEEPQTVQLGLGFRGLGFRGLGGMKNLKSYSLAEFRLEGFRV